MAGHLRLHRRTPRQGVAVAHGQGNDGVEALGVHALEGGEERPLIGIGLQGVVDKHAVMLGSGAFLQRQGDQVAKAAFGQGVLVGKQPVVGTERQLPCALTGVADDGGP